MWVIVYAFARQISGKIDRKKLPFTLNAGPDQGLGGDVDEDGDGKKDGEDGDQPDSNAADAGDGGSALSADQLFEKELRLDAKSLECLDICRQILGAETRFESHFINDAGADSIQLALLTGTLRNVLPKVTVREMITKTNLLAILKVHNKPKTAEEIEAEKAKAELNIDPDARGYNDDLNLNNPNFIERRGHVIGPIRFLMLQILFIFVTMCWGVAFGMFEFVLLMDLWNQVENLILGEGIEGEVSRYRTLYSLILVDSTISHFPSHKRADSPDCNHECDPQLQFWNLTSYHST